MSDLEDKIKALLGSPDKMSEIVNVAQSMLGGTKKEDVNDILDNDGKEEINHEVSVNSNDDVGFFDQLDPKVISAAMEIMGEYRNVDDRRIRLLQALRGYFNDEDQIHITKAIQIVKLSKVAKSAFNSIKEGDMFV